MSREFQTQTAPVVAIDGPSGVGKSTVAQALAARLGVPVLDTGAMYRAVALAVLEAGVDPHERAAALAVAEQAVVDVRDDGRGGVEVTLDGLAVEPRIRTPEVSAASSVVSAYPEVRHRLVALQREVGERLGAVVEGRDIGTVVFPETPYKFFLDARPEIRAWRRQGQLAETGESAELEQVQDELDRRDERDRSRSDSPLRHDGSYTLIDTSDASVEEIVERMAAVIRGS